MLEQINQVLDDVSSQISEENEQVSEYVRKLVGAMEYDVPYTANTLLEKLGLRSKETFRKHYLKPAMERGLVEMTLPDKPNSRNQRYIKR